jgi:hypothetical protein
VRIERTGAGSTAAVERDIPTRSTLHRGAAEPRASAATATGRHHAQPPS